MPPRLDSAKTTLSYPLYACDFFPGDATKLAVGGGGGAGKSGIGNKITILDVSSEQELKQIGDIDLSKDEDNVTSLAVGQGTGKKTLIYAGISSSAASRESGKNEHFRVFGAVRNNISEIARSSLFESKSKETYQRVLRISQAFNGTPQLGAVATAFASKEEEIVLFNTTKTPTKAPNVRGRIKLEDEAEDLDLIQTGSDEHLLAYCTKQNIYLKTVSSTTDPGDPILVTPPPTELKRLFSTSYRSLRFLSPKFLLMLSNFRDRKGALLVVMRLPQKQGARASLALVERLPSRVKQATGLAVSNLSPRDLPTSEQGYTQFVIAVAGQDSSISLYSLNHQREAGVSMVSLLKPLQTINDVHPFPITGLVLSTFSPPTGDSASKSIKLASISAGNTAVVHTIPLFRAPQKGPRRYVVSSDTDVGLFAFNVLASIIVALVLALVAEIVLEIRGTTPTLLKATDYVQPDVQGWIKWDHPIPNAILGAPKPVIASTLPVAAAASSAAASSSASEFVDNSIASALEALKSHQAENSGEDRKQPVVFLREHRSDSTGQQDASLDESSIKADLQDESVHGPHNGKTWDDLTPEDREKWTKRLKDAGHWTEDFTNTILKSVVFGMVGAAVGGAVGG